MARIDKMPDRESAVLVQKPADIGAAIRARRKELGYTQEFFAQMLGYSPRLIGEIERGAGPWASRRYCGTPWASAWTSSSTGEGPRPRSATESRTDIAEDKQRGTEKDSHCASIDEWDAASCYNSRQRRGDALIGYAEAGALRG